MSVHVGVRHGERPCVLCACMHKNGRMCCGRGRGGVNEPVDEMQKEMMKDWKNRGIRE